MMTSLHVIHIPEEENRVDQYWDVLSEEEKITADRFVRYADKLCFVVTRASLRTLLADRLEKHPSTLEIEYASKGKPQLSGEDRNSIFFNASHSGEYSVLALNGDHEIGVDIELKRTIRNLDKLAARFFTEGEYQEFKSHKDEQTAFFSIWTLKEAIVKLTGKGISGGLSKFDVSLNPKGDSHLTRLENEKWKFDEIKLSTFLFNDRYAAAFATASSSNSFTIEKGGLLAPTVVRA